MNQTLNMNSSSTTLEETISCRKFFHWGVYLSILFLVSFAVNFGFLVVILKKKEFRRTTNKFLVGMILVCLIGTLSDLPLLIIKSFSCEYKRVNTIYPKISCLNYLYLNLGQYSSPFRVS